MKELFKTGGEMPDTNYVFMVRTSLSVYASRCPLYTSLFVDQFLTSYK